MTPRRPIVAVFGGDAEPAEARALGAALTRAGVWILTGRRPGGNGRVTGEVPAGAIDAERAGEGVARLIAIEPSERRAFEQTAPHRLVIASGCSHIVRDGANGLTPDAVIATNGAEGTLCELAFAAAAGKPVVFLASTATLRARFDELRETGVRDYLITAQAAYRHFTVQGLDAALERLLSSAADAGTIDDAAAAAVAALCHADSLRQTSFPGIPDGDAESIAWFTARTSAA